MKRAVLLVFVCMVLSANGPPKRDYFDAEVIEVATLPNGSFSYVLLAQRDRFTCSSRFRLKIKEGSRVKMAETERSLWIVDVDGKPQQTKYLQEDLLPAPPPPRK